MKYSYSIVCIIVVVLTTIIITNFGNVNNYLLLLLSTFIYFISDIFMKFVLENFINCRHSINQFSLFLDKK